MRRERTTPVRERAGARWRMRKDDYSTVSDRAERGVDLGHHCLHRRA
jgi:hypothetical protein